MTRTALLAPLGALTLLPAQALAHGAHIASAAGHDHVVELGLLALGIVALAGIGIAIARRFGGGSPR